MDLLIRDFRQPHARILNTQYLPRTFHVCPLFLFLAFCSCQWELWGLLLSLFFQLFLRRPFLFTGSAISSKSKSPFPTSSCPPPFSTPLATLMIPYAFSSMISLNYPQILRNIERNSRYGYMINMFP